MWHTLPVDSRPIHCRSITQIQLGVELCEEVQIEITRLILVDIRVNAGVYGWGGIQTPRKFLHTVACTKKLAAHHLLSGPIFTSYHSLCCYYSLRFMLYT